MLNPFQMLAYPGNRRCLYWNVCARACEVDERPSVGKPEESLRPMVSMVSMASTIEWRASDGRAGAIYAFAV